MPPHIPDNENSGVKALNVLAINSALCAAEPKKDLALIQHNVDLLEAAQIADGDNWGGWAYSTPGALVDNASGSRNARLTWAMPDFNCVRNISVSLSKAGRHQSDGIGLWALNQKASVFINNKSSKYGESCAAPKALLCKPQHSGHSRASSRHWGPQWSCRDVRMSWLGDTGVI